MTHQVTAGTDALFTAVLRGDEDAVVALLGSGVSAETSDEDDQTALHLAAVQDQPGIVRRLLAAGADPNRGSGPQAGELPLCGAAIWGLAETVRALLEAGARPDSREEFGGTALLGAVEGGHAATADVLLTFGADSELATEQGVSPLVVAVRRGSPAVVRVLLEHGVSLPGQRVALAEARLWLDRDVAEDLHTELVLAHGEGHRAVTRRETGRDGVETVVVELLRNDEPFAGRERETGHRNIAALLEEALDERTG
ncbi:ankyrin repeat domain-containing protein [Streptomyces sp. NPDC056500]|uniref:ankyrin repeat domain-containing protein n=1 Tax=Streptomyces sp. NPDC056500 TaxID=3345840 RepID=UPI0036D0C1AA